MSKLAIVHYSNKGHTEEVAKYLKLGADDILEAVTLYNIFKNDIDIETLCPYDGIIFGSPTYFGGMAGGMKMFLDKGSSIYMKKLFKDKICGVFSHSSSLSGDKLGTLQQLYLFALQNGMIMVGVGENPTGTSKKDTNRLGAWLGLMTQSTMEDGLCEGDIKTAKAYGRRVAEIIVKYNN